MRLFLRSLIILAAAVLVGGLLVGGVLVRGGRILPRSPGGRPPPVDTNGLVRINPGGGAPSGFVLKGPDFGSAEANWFGLETALGNLLIVGWVMLLGVIALRWAKRRRRGGGSG